MLRVLHSRSSGGSGHCVGCELTVNFIFRLALSAREHKVKASVG